MNGVQLHYTEAGSGNQETVVLLHGGMGDLGSWTHQVRALEAQYRVVSYSRRHNHPNRNRDIQRARFAEYVDDDIEDLLALQRALRVGRLHLIGTSYGALLALAGRAACAARGRQPSACGTATPSLGLREQRGPSPL